MYVVTFIHRLPNVPPHTNVFFSTENDLEPIRSFLLVIFVSHHHAQVFYFAANHRNASAQQFMNNNVSAAGSLTGLLKFCN